MEMIAMLSGLSGSTDMWQSNSGGGYTPSATGQGGESSGGSGGYQWSNRTGGKSSGGSGASTATSIDQFLLGKGLAEDLPALAKPSKPVAVAPYIAGQTKADFLANIGLGGGIPTAGKLIQNARDKVAAWATAGGLEEQRRRRSLLLAALLTGQQVVDGDWRANAFTVQMARDKIIELTTGTGEKYFDDVRIKASDAAKKAYGYFGDMKGVAKIVFDAATSDAEAITLLRSFAAQAYSPAPMSYPNLNGIDASGFPALFDKIKGNPPAVIIGAAYRFVATQFGKTGKYPWTAFSTAIPGAIAEGLVIRDYKTQADQVFAWNDGQARYRVQYNTYVKNLDNWQKREDYRNSRIKAIEEYWTNFGKDAGKKGDKSTKDAADAKAREEKAIKDKEDADRARKDADEVNRKLQETIDALDKQIMDMKNASSSGDTAAMTESKAMIDALNAMIAELKQQVIDAQNAAAEAARNAANNASGGSTGIVTPGTADAAASATQSANEATQTAIDVLNQTGEPVVFKTPAAKSNTGMLLLAAAAIGGFWWWRATRRSAP